MRTQIIGLSAIFIVALAMMPGQASSHREAPLIAHDPMADNTDVYAFVSPDEPDMVTLHRQLHPVPEARTAGRTSTRSIRTSSTRSTSTTTATRSKTSPFSGASRPSRATRRRSSTTPAPVTSLDDPDLNVRQFYRLTRIDGPRRTGTVAELSGRLPVPPPNIGPRSTPNYGALAGGMQQLAGNTRVFAGQRDEGFYVDLGIFDLLGVGDGPGRGQHRRASTSARSRSRCRCRR